MKRLFAMLLAVLMMVAIAMPVFANSDAGSETEEVLSPTEQPKYKIDIYYDLDTIVYDGQVLVIK